MENKHPQLQHLRSKRKRANSANSSGEELDAVVLATNANQSANSQSFDDALRRLFSEFPDFSPPDGDKAHQLQQQREEITYSHLDAEGTTPSTNEPSEAVTSFPEEHEAGKVIAAYPFVEERHPMHNFFTPFQNAMDFKLARFFYSAHVPKARIDEFFHDGFVGQQADAIESPPNGVGSPLFSFRSAHTLYKNIDNMIVDPPWMNGFVDFRLAKNTEFWYRDILKVLKFLLRRKSLGRHMFWAPVRQFDTQHERVYSEMNTASWWWDTQVCNLFTGILQLLTQDVR